MENQQAIEAFWGATLARLAQEPLEAECEKLAEPLPYLKYRVTWRSLDGVRVVGLLGKPIRGEEKSRPLPAIVTAPGYGGGEQGVTLEQCERGYIVLQVFPRGMGPSAELWQHEGDYLSTHLHSPEGHFYQGCYSDVLRGVDYLTTRDDVDANRLGIIGTSQGGGIALAVGSLDARLKAVVAHVPFLCAMRASLHLDSSLVQRLLAPGGLGTEQAFATLDHFDPLNLVHRLLAPTLVSTGGKDLTCPTASIQAVFDALPGIKTVAHYPDLIHTSCGDFFEMSWDWLDRYVRRA